MLILFPLENFHNLSIVLLIEVFEVDFGFTISEDNSGAASNGPMLEGVLDVEMVVVFADIHRVIGVHGFCETEVDGQFLFFLACRPSLLLQHQIHFFAVFGLNFALGLHSFTLRSTRSLISLPLPTNSLTSSRSLPSSCLICLFLWWMAQECLKVCQEAKMVKAEVRLVRKQLASLRNWSFISELNCQTYPIDSFFKIQFQLMASDDQRNYLASVLSYYRRDVLSTQQPEIASKIVQRPKSAFSPRSTHPQNPLSIPELRLRENNHFESGESRPARETTRQIQRDISNNKQALDELLALVQKRNTARKATSLQQNQQSRPASSPQQSQLTRERIQVPSTVLNVREVDDLVEVRDKVSELLTMLNKKIDDKKKGTKLTKKAAVGSKGRASHKQWLQSAKQVESIQNVGEPSPVQRITYHQLAHQLRMASLPQNAERPSIFVRPPQQHKRTDTGSTNAPKVSQILQHQLGNAQSPKQSYLVQPQIQQPSESDPSSQEQVLHSIPSIDLPFTQPQPYQSHSPSHNPFQSPSTMPVSIAQQQQQRSKHSIMSYSKPSQNMATIHEHSSETQQSLIKQLGDLSNQKPIQESLVSNVAVYGRVERLGGGSKYASPRRKGLNVSMKQQSRTQYYRA